MMPENIRNDEEEVVRERAHTSSKNAILMLPDIIRAYHAMGLLSQGEVDELNDMQTDDAKITFLTHKIGKIGRLPPEKKLDFCEAFVGDDLTTFHNATPAILAGAYRAAFAKAKNDVTQKERLQKIAARIDELSADFANSGGMIVNEEVVNPANVADVYEGFADMLVARMGDVNKMSGADKDERIAARKQEMESLGVPLSETQIARINDNFDVLRSVIRQYDDDLWGLKDITEDNASKLENRWDKLDYRLARAQIYDETKEIMAKYKFLDDNGEEIPQFNKNGRRVLNGSRLYIIQELARHNVEKRHVGRIGEKINADALEDEFNGEILFLLWNMKNQGRNVEAAIDDPEIFIDYTNRDTILASMGQEGGEISDRTYKGMLFTHESETKGWLARIKAKTGNAGQRDDVKRFYDKASFIDGADARMRERMQQCVRILKGFASAFIATTIIISVGTAAAVTAGLSPAAGLAMFGLITSLGFSLAQFHRWKKNWETSQIAAGKPHDRETMRKAFFADKNLLASFGVSAIAVVAMVFGAAGMAQAAMILGFGALTLGGLKNSREAYFAARKKMSVVESLAWAIANAGAIAAGGFAGREAAHGLIDWVNERWPENTIFKKEVATAHEHSITGDVDHTKTVINYPDGMIDHAEAAVRNWYAEQYPNNPEILQQHIDAVNQYNADYGTNLDPWVTLRAMELCNGHSGYGAPGWMHQYGYTSEQIAAGANAITADGYNPDGMARLIDLQTNHLDKLGHIGLVDGHVLRPNDLYSDTQHTPTQQTLSYSEPKTVVSDVPDVVHVPVHIPDMMAAYGTYNPLEESAPQMDRVGSMPDRMQEDVPTLWIERSQAKKWQDLHKQLEKVIVARGKNPNPSLANQLRAQETDIRRRIAQLRNELGHASDAEIERGIKAAEKREEGKIQQKEHLQTPKEIIQKPEEITKAPEAVVNTIVESKYPMSDKVEKIIKGMPELQRKEGRDSLASIQQGDSYPPVKALVGVFTWTHDIIFASDILKLLPTEEKRETLLREAIDYYKEHYDNDRQFFNDVIVKDFATLAFIGVISSDAPRSLKKYFDEGKLGIESDVIEDVYPPKGIGGNTDEENIFAPQDESQAIVPEPEEEPDKRLEDVRINPVEKEQDEIPVAPEHDNPEIPQIDDRDGKIPDDNVVFGVNVGDMIRKPDEEPQKIVPVSEKEPVVPVKEEHAPKANTLQEAVLEAQAKRISGGHEGRIYLEPKALAALAKQGSLTKTLNAEGKSIPKPIGAYNGLPFHFVDINGNGNPFADSADGPVVIVNWQGIRIPFVLSTGMNPDNPVTPGKWYPVSMVRSNGRFYNPNHTDAHIAYETGEYHNDSECEYGQLMEIAEYLDHKIGDIRNWQDAEYTNIGGCDVIPDVNVRDVIDELQRSGYASSDEDNENWLYTPGPDYANRDEHVGHRALEEMEDPDWHKENYNMFGRLRSGVSRVGDVVSTVAQKIRGFFRRRERGEE